MNDAQFDAHRWFSSAILRSRSGPFVTARGFKPWYYKRNIAQVSFINREFFEDNIMS